MICSVKMIDITQWRARVGLWNCSRAASPRSRHRATSGGHQPRFHHQRGIKEKPRPQMLSIPRILLLLFVKIIVIYHRYIYQAGQYSSYFYFSFPWPRAQGCFGSPAEPRSYFRPRSRKVGVVSIIKMVWIC